MPLFIRPHLSACDSFVELKIDFAEFRAVASYEDWRAQVKAELDSVYRATPAALGAILYSTKEEPTHFSSEVSEKLYDMVRNHDAAVEQVKELGNSLAAGEAEMEEAQAARDPEKKMTKKERKAEDDQRQKLKNLRKEIAQKQYEVDCLSLKLSNAFNMEAVRVLLI